MKLFPVDHKSPKCFRRKDFLKRKWVRFLIGDPPAKPAKQKKNKLLLKNHLCYTLAKVWPHPRKGCNSYYTKTFFLQNSWSCPQTYLVSGCRRKSPLDGPTDFQQQFDSTLRLLVLCKLSFWFWPGSLKMPLSVSELGLNIIQLILKLLRGCLPIDNWSRVQPLYAGKKIVMVTPSLPSHLVMHFRWFGP